MARYKITCPYCFAQFSDTAVHFRLKTAYRAGTDEPLPDGYDDWDEVASRYPSGTQKDMLLSQHHKYQFLSQHPDKKYQRFWENFGGRTTELRPEDALDAVEPYLRPVADPNNVIDQRFLRAYARGADGTVSYMHYDADGMADAVCDIEGKVSNLRVCPECHNPLPIHYGKNPVRFISVIGVSGAGKTVYLSQLVRGIVANAAKVGLTAHVTSNSTRQFLKENPVQMNVPLPGSTQPENFVQPLFYDLARMTPDGNRESNTIVLYDIAGENCIDDEKMVRFGEFVRRSDGIILLLDPKQLPFVGDSGGDIEQVTAVLDTLYLTITGSRSAKSKIPLAVCIPKADKPAVQQIFTYDPNEDFMWYQPPTPPKKHFWERPVTPPPEKRPDLDTRRLLGEEVKNLVHPQTRLPVSMFYATDYNAISRKLERMIGRYVPELGIKLNTNYDIFNFFAFSALGCDVVEREDENHLRLSYPISAISPKRIEEPLYWLFCQFGYISPNEALYRPFSGK